MAFEHFKKSDNRMVRRGGGVGAKDTEPCVTVSRNSKGLWFNLPLSAFVEKEGYTHTELFFDRDTNTLGLRFMKKKTADNYSLHKSMSDHFKVSCKSFIRAYDIDRLVKDINQKKFVATELKVDFVVIPLKKRNRRGKIDQKFMGGSWANHYV